MENLSIKNTIILRRGFCTCVAEGFNPRICSLLEKKICQVNYLLGKNSQKRKYVGSTGVCITS